MFTSLLAVAKLSSQFTTQSLFSQGPKKNIQVSPDGKRIVFLSLENGIYQVFKEHINGGEIVQLSSVAGPDVSQVAWVDDETVVFLHETDMNGSDMLYSVNLNDATSRLISPPGRDVNILGIDNSNNKVIFELRSEFGAYYDLCSFNRRYKNYEIIQKNEGDVSYWGVTTTGQLNCWVENNQLGTRIIGASAGSVTKLLSTDSPLFLKPIAPSSSKKGSYIFLTDSKRKGLHFTSYDLATGSETEAIVTPEGTTIEEYSLANSDGRILEIGIRNLKDGSVEYLQIDKAYEDIFNQVSSINTMPGRIKFSNVDRIENVWIFELIDDYGRVSTMRYNKANKEVRIIAGDVTAMKKDDPNAPSFNEKNPKNGMSTPILRRESRNPIFDIDAAELIIPTKSIFIGDLGFPVPVEIYSPLEITSQTYFILHPHLGESTEHLTFNGNAQYLVRNNMGYIDFDLSNYPSSIKFQGAENWLKLLTSDIALVEDWFLQMGLAKPNRILLLGEGITAFPLMEAALQGKINSKQIALLNPLSDLNSLGKNIQAFSEENLWWFSNNNKAFQPLSFGAANHFSSEIIILTNKKGDGYMQKQANALAENLRNNSFNVNTISIGEGTYSTPSERGHAMIAEELLSFFIRSVKGSDENKAGMQPNRK